MTLFYIFASLLVIQSAISLWEGYRYLVYVRKSLAEQLPEFTPKVALLAPCKGIDDGMDDYLRSLFELDYPDYQIIFVIENPQDSAAAVIDRYAALHPNVKARCVIAGRSQNCGQKVHNLLVALAEVDPSVTAFAFVDSDVCLPRHWLRNLIAPLSDSNIGATTGYRWFIPSDQRVASLLRSVWNGSTATTLGDHRRNFAWGGSMAILRATFERIDVRRYWQGTVSDDYALTKAVQSAGLFVKFVPQCLVPSLGGCRLGELLEFTTRQIIITRIYSTGLWRLLLVSNLIFNLVFYGGILISLRAGSQGNYLPAILILAIYLLGVGKGYLRIKAITLAMPVYRDVVMKRRWSYYLLAPVVALIFLYNLIGSTFTNRITWRGITYELRSFNETIRS